MHIDYSALKGIDSTLGAILVVLIFIASYLGHIAKSVGKIADKDE